MLSIGVGLTSLPVLQRPGASTPAPVNSVAPVISGTATEGQTLTVTPGTWS